MKYADKYGPVRNANIACAIKDVEPVVSNLINAKNEEDIRNSLGLFARIFGISATGHISVLFNSLDNIGHYNITSEMDDYTKDYVNMGLNKIDPVFYKGRFETLPISWGLQQHRNNLAPEEKPLYSLMDDYGLGCGILVSIHGPQGYSVLGIAVDEKECSFSKRIEVFSSSALLVAAYIHDSIRRIVGIKPETQVRLTPRESECLNWVAAGKTAWEISQILHISESTAIFHIENAKKKLGAKTLPQAIARACLSGLIN